MTSLLCFMAACHVFATSVKTDSSCTFQNDACDVSDFVVVLSIAAFFFFFFFLPLLWLVLQGVSQLPRS